MSYAAVIVEEFPSEMQPRMLRFASALEQNLREQIAVRREDVQSLRDEMIAGQQRTDQRMDRLEHALVTLAEAQQRTEVRVEQLAEAQQRTEQRLEELAQAQQRTEARVEQLAEAQQRTEQRLEELAQAQQRTEEKLQSLTEKVEDLVDVVGDVKRQVGGLSMTVGYRLEDLAYRALPDLLARDYGITLQERLTRGYVVDDRGRVMEVNILGKAQRNGQAVTIVGESKAQLSKNDVDQFIRRRLERLRGVYSEVFPILVTYMISEPDVEEYVQDKEIALYYSYDF